MIPEFFTDFLPYELIIWFPSIMKFILEKWNTKSQCHFCKEYLPEIVSYRKYICQQCFIAHKVMPGKKKKLVRVWFDTKRCWDFRIEEIYL